jgi:AcrR family transcriptional regulator
MSGKRSAAADAARARERSARDPAPGPKQQLLDRAIDYVAANGIGDLSLRALAAQIGTSHRMLIHHFGSKAGLWVAIVQAVEQRQRELLSEIIPDPAAADGEAMRAWWRHISDPSLWPNERLFFEVYGQALQGRAHTTALLEGIVDQWLHPIVQLSVAQGVPRAAARGKARLGIAVTRGLLLDLLATGEVAEVDAAMEAFIDLYQTWLRSRADRPAARPPGDPRSAGSGRRRGAR